MTSKVEKRRAFLINVAFLAVVLGLVYIFFKYMFWAAAPFLLSFFFLSFAKESKISLAQYFLFLQQFLLC